MPRFGFYYVFSSPKVSSLCPRFAIGWLSDEPPDQRSRTPRRGAIGGAAVAHAAAASRRPAVAGAAAGSPAETPRSARPGDNGGPGPTRRPGVA